MKHKKYGYGSSDDAGSDKPLMVVIVCLFMVALAVAIYTASPAEKSAAPKPSVPAPGCPAGCKCKSGGKVCCCSGACGPCRCAACDCKGSVKP